MPISSSYVWQAALAQSCITCRPWCSTLEPRAFGAVRSATPLISIRTGSCCFKVALNQGAQSDFVAPHSATRVERSINYLTSFKPVSRRVRCNAAVNIKSFFELGVERLNSLSKGLPEISCHVANEAMH